MKDEEGNVKKENERERVVKKMEKEREGRCERGRESAETNGKERRRAGQEGTGKGEGWQIPLRSRELSR